MNDSFVMGDFDRPSPTENANKTNYEKYLKDVYLEEDITSNFEEGDTTVGESKHYKEKYSEEINLSQERSVKIKQTTTETKTNYTYSESGLIIQLPEFDIEEDPERQSQKELTEELIDLAVGKSDETNSNNKSTESIQENGMIVELPAAELDYGALASIAQEDINATEDKSCNENVISVGVNFALAKLGFKKAKQNKTCQLAKAVEQSCTIAEAVSFEVEHAPNLKTMRKRAQTVVTASKFCAETIDATNKELARLQKEKEEKEALAWIKEKERNR